MTLPKHLFIFLLILLLASCKKASKTTDTNWTYQVSKLKHGYLDLHRQLLHDAQLSTDLMDTKISSFCSVPLLPMFQQSKDNWFLAYADFQLLGPFRNTSSSVSNPFYLTNNSFDLSSLNESYIDYTQSSPTAGIIQDEANYPSVIEATLTSWNQAGSPQNVSLGFHAIEFLLWGEDLNASGTGARLHQDYVGNTTIVNRRRSFLRYASLNLNKSLENIELNNSFESQLLQLSPQEGFDYMMSGLLYFIKTEFAENSVLKPYQSQNQFDEISRFSDNTLVDFTTRYKAIELFLDPKPYLTNSSNYYLIDFIKEVDPAVYETVVDQLATIKADIAALQVRFDVAISSGVEQPKIYKLYQDLMALHQTLSSFSATIN